MGVWLRFLKDSLQLIPLIFFVAIAMLLQDEINYLEMAHLKCLKTY